MTETTGELRCGLCHDALTGADQVRCPGCATLLHGECRTQLGRCPTLGCAEGAATTAPAPKPPEYALFGERQIVWWGILFSPAAGSALLAMNMIRRRRPRAALAALGLVWAVLGTGLIVSSGPVGPLLWLSIGASVALGRLGRPDIADHERAGGRRSSGLSAVGVALGGAFVFMGFAFVVQATGQVLLWKGIQYRLQAEDPEGALRLCDALEVISGPDDPAAQAQRGHALQLADRDDEALAAFDRAVRLAPGDPDLLARRGLVRAKKGDVRAALADLDRALGLDPTLGWVHEGRDWVQGLLDERLRRLEELEEAARHDPNPRNLARRDVARKAVAR